MGDQKLLTKEMILATKPCYSPDIPEAQVWTLEQACLDKSFPAHDRLYVIAHYMTPEQVESFANWCVKKAALTLVTTSDQEFIDSSYDPLYYLDRVVAWWKSDVKDHKRLKGIAMNLALGMIATEYMVNINTDVTKLSEKTWDTIMFNLMRAVKERK